jgi:hypothetical protein
MLYNVMYNILYINNYFICRTVGTIVKNNPSKIIFDY